MNRFIALGLAIIGVSGLAWGLKGSYDSLAAIYAARLVSLANQDRGSTSPELKVSPLLTQAAQNKANDMAARGYFAHVNPDGKTPWQWMSDAGYNYVYAGENLAVDFSQSEDVNNAWLNSPLHKANIVNSRFTEIGIATAEGMYNGHKATFVVQMFGAPFKATYLVDKKRTVKPMPVALKVPEVLGDFIAVESKPQVSYASIYITLLSIVVLGASFTLATRRV